MPSKQVSGGLKLVAAVVGMVAFSYAMVPLYNVLCDITGLNGKTSREVEAELTYKVDSER